MRSPRRSLHRREAQGTGSRTGTARAARRTRRNEGWYQECI